ncbi:hypothetical protein D3C71_1942230 [compost metagenome]
MLHHVARRGIRVISYFNSRCKDNHFSRRSPVADQQRQHDGRRDRRLGILLWDRQHEFFDVPDTRIRIVGAEHRASEVADPRCARFANSRTTWRVDDPELLHNVQSGQGFFRE